VVFEGVAASGQSTLPARLPVHLQHIDADVRDLVTMRLEGTFVLVSPRQHRLTQWILESDDDWGHLYTNEGVLMQTTDS